MRRLLLALLLATTAAIGTTAQTRSNSAFENYIDTYKYLAMAEMRKHRIPASITLAQGLLESGAGRSDLARKGNNHFGIKCHGWSGRKTYHDDDEQGECFRAYNSVAESYEDHSRFLSGQSRYARLFRLSPTDYKGWAHGLKACGYATNPQYAYRLIDIIERYKLYIYDDAKNYDKFMAKRSYAAANLHPIYKYNKNYYLIAREGDTFESIGREVGISGRKIAKANERDRRDKLTAGEVVYLKKKQKRADKAFKNRLHTVRAGESMYSIAQYYGMRLKYLYKKNLLDESYEIKVGDKLLVY